jgi:hypothetical protein
MNFPTVLEYLELKAPYYNIDEPDRERKMLEGWLCMRKAVTRYSRTVTLGDFVACNEAGEPMEMPHSWGVKDIIADHPLMSISNKEYQAAVDRVLFEGWKLGVSGTYILYKDKLSSLIWIADLANYHSLDNFIHLESDVVFPTKSAIKTYNLKDV